MIHAFRTDYINKSVNWRKMMVSSDQKLKYEQVRISWRHSTMKSEKHFIFT